MADLTKDRLFTEEVKKLVPVLGRENVARLERAYLVGDEASRRRIIEMVDLTKARVFADKDLKDAVLVEPLPREYAEGGSVNVGTVLYGRKTLYPLTLKKELLLTHMGIFGSSGYGKTNLVYSLTKTLAEQDVPMLIFDFSKRNYRELLSIPELKDRVNIYTVGRKTAPFKFNPLAPPEGVSITQWAKEFAEVFDHAYWMMGGGRHVILKILGDVYKKAAPKMPNIVDLKWWMEQYASDASSARERNWVATAERPLESLCFGDTKDVFDCQKGVSPSEFFKKGRITVLELDALDTNDRTFIIEILLQWIRDWLLVSGAKEELKGVIVIEEAHHVLNREKSRRLGSETVIDLIFREVRELGIGMIYTDQHPSLISYPALGNTSSHVYMNLGLDTQHSSDIRDASNMLGLDYREEGGYLRRLPVGHAFFLCRQLEFPHPFLVEFPMVELKKGTVTDDNVKKHMEGRTPQEEASQAPLAETDELGQTVEEEMVEAVEEERAEAQEAPAEPDEHGWQIVKALGMGLGASTAQVYKAAGMSGSTFKQHVEKLAGQGLVGSTEVKVYRQKAVYYYLPERGLELFSSRYSVKEEPDAAEKFEKALEFFALHGWAYDREREQLVTRKKGRMLFVSVETKANREKLSLDIDRTAREEGHFVCASEAIKTMLLQEAARHAGSEKRELSVHVVTLDELEKGRQFRPFVFKP